MANVDKEFVCRVKRMEVMNAVGHVRGVLTNLENLVQKGVITDDDRRELLRGVPDELTELFPAPKKDSCDA